MNANCIYMVNMLANFCMTFEYRMHLGTAKYER